LILFIVITRNLINLYFELYEEDILGRFNNFIFAKKFENRFFTRRNTNLLAI